MRGLGGKIRGPVKIESATEKHGGFLDARESHPDYGWAGVDGRRFVGILTFIFQLVVHSFHC